MHLREETTESVLIDAVTNNAIEDVERIIASADSAKLETAIIRRRGQRFENLLHIAAKNGQLIIFKLLISKVADKTYSLKIPNIQGYHVLHFALLKNHVELARFILETITEPKERNSILGCDESGKKCKDYIESPEALRLVYGMYDDTLLKYHVPEVLGKYYHSGVAPEYFIESLELFKRAFLNLPIGERKNYILYSVTPILEKAIVLAEIDNFQLLNLMIQGLDDSDREAVCINGLKYTDSRKKLEYLLSHIINKTLLLNNLLEKCEQNAPIFLQRDNDLISFYLSALIEADPEVAEILKDPPLNLQTVLVNLEQLKALNDKRAQSARSVTTSDTSTLRKTRGSLLLDFLDHQSLLTLRRVNKANLKFVGQISGPYTSPQEFAAATTGVYTSCDVFKDARDNYFKTINSPSTHPAVLYKLKEHDFGLPATHEFSERHKENLVETGRKYGPSKHNWSVNAAWVLAQCHKGRDFVFLSDLFDPYVKRANGIYSALTKEVACAIVKAGYRTSVEQFGTNCHTFFLRKSRNTSQLCQMKINDFLNLRDEQCQYAVSLVQVHLQENLEETKKRANEVINYFKRLYNCHSREVFELIDYMKIQADIGCLRHYLSLYSHKGKSIPQSFLNYYNAQRTSLNLEAIIPQLPALNFSREHTHEIAPSQIADKLSSAFLQLYCDKEDMIETQSKNGLN